MAKVRIAHRKPMGEREVQEIEGGGFRIPSFTDPNVEYAVYPDSGRCDCDRYRFTKKCIKHIELAKAIEKCRKLRFGSWIAEARVIELAHRLYSPVRRGECFVASYELLIGALGSRHATEGMKKAALKRHGRVLLLHERRVA